MVRSKFSVALLSCALIAAPFCSAFAESSPFERVKTINLLPAQVDTKPLGAKFKTGITAIRLGKKYGTGRSKKDSYCHITGKVGAVSAVYRTRTVKIKNRRVRVRELHHYIFTPLSAKSKSDKKALTLLINLCNLRITSFFSSSSATSSSAPVQSSAASSSALSVTGISSTDMSSIATQSSSVTSSLMQSSAPASVGQSSSAQSSAAQSSAAQSSAAQSSASQSSMAQSSSSQSSVGTACPPAGFNAIRTAADFVAIETNPAGSFMLCNDITLSGEFMPMFNDAIRFSGILDGGNHVIRGLTMSRANDAGAAIIMTNSQESQIRNLIIENPIVEADLLASALIGVNSGTIDNVRVIGGSITSSRGWAGAVAGMSNSRPTNCSTTAEILGFNTLGGLIGLLVPR